MNPDGRAGGDGQASGPVPVAEVPAGAAALLAEAGRLLRYAIVGTAATALHFGVLAAVVELGGWPAWVGSGCGAVAGAQLAYLGNRLYTFRYRGSVRSSWPRYQLAALAGGVLGMAIVAAAVRLGMHYLLAQAAATLTVMFATFAINRWWTFRTRPRRA